MVKAIDWRLRPPFGTFIEGPLYTEHFQNCKPFTMEETLQEMDKAEVEIGMCPFRIGMDPEDMQRLADYNSERFKIMAHIDPWDGAKAIDDIEKYVINGPASAIIMEPGQRFIRQTLRADDAKLYPIYEYCERHDIVTTLTYGGMYNYNVGLYQPAYIANVANDFPNLKLVLSHGGWPYVTEICHVAMSHQYVYISPDGYIGSDRPGYQDFVTAANFLLQDRFIFGSAAAFRTGMEGHLLKTRQKYESVLSETAAAKVLWHNAAQLLGFEPIKKIPVL